MNIKHLQRQRDAAIESATAIIEAAEAESRGFTDEERTKLAEYKAARAQAESDIAAAEEWARTAPAIAAPVEKPKAADISVKEAIEDKPWESLGEFLQAVISAESPTGTKDPRLMAASGASSGVPSDGGFLVRTDFSTQLLNKAATASVLAPRCTSITIGANSDGIELPYIDETSRANGSRFGGVQVYWKAEADTVTATKPKFGEQEIRLQELMGIAYATERLLKDATALESIFTLAFTSEFAYKIDDAIFSGDGVGKPLGITSSSGPRVEVAKESGQAADTIVFENIVKMWSRGYAPSRPNMVWIINQDIEPQLMSMSLAVGTGGVPVYLPANGLSGSPFATLMGRPVIPIEQASTLGDAGDIVLADLSEYLLITKGGIEAAQSMHVRFLYNEQTFRWNYRINGRPSWRTALTPAKGSNTVSPFVTLAARA